MESLIRERYRKRNEKILELANKGWPHKSIAAMMKIKNPVKGISSFSSANDPMMKINIVKNIGKKEIIEQKLNPETKFKSTEGTRFEIGVQHFVKTNIGINTWI